MALNDESKIAYMNLYLLHAGSSYHCFDNNLDAHFNEFKPMFTQGCLGVSVDDLIKDFKLPVPNYIKIDVDGIEHLIVKGMKETLKTVL